jgi:hypothetical protein
MCFRKMDVNNVGREVEVRVEEMTLMVQMQQNPAETEELLGDVEVLADRVDMEPGLSEAQRCFQEFARPGNIHSTRSRNRGQYLA